MRTPGSVSTIKIPLIQLVAKLMMHPTIQVGVSKGWLTNVKELYGISFETDKEEKETAEATDPLAVEPEPEARPKAIVE